MGVTSVESAATPPARTASAKYVIVNADDFGFSTGVSRGILQAHRQGIVTSTSLMVRWPAAADAVAQARDCPALSLGLHVDLGEWVYRDGQWEQLYAVLDESASDSAAAVAAEVDRQLDAFAALVGRPPSHVDSHQHVHRASPLREVLLERAARLRIPLRHFDPDVRYVGSFYGQAGKGEPYPEGVRAETLCHLIATLPPGITELGCHPALFTDHTSPYGTEREVELATLCDPRVRDALDAAHATLISFADVPACRAARAVAPDVT